MGKRKNNQELLPPEIIIGALDGDSEAMQEVIKHFEKKIHDNFVYQAQKRGIKVSHLPLVDMEQEVRIHLMKAIRKFVV